MASELRLDDQEWIKAWLPSRKELSNLVGMAVMRGSTWAWGNQDGRDTKGKRLAVGIVMGIDASGWVRVKWQYGTSVNTYRVGNGYSDLRFVSSIQDVDLDSMNDWEIQSVIDAEVSRLQNVQNQQF